MPSQLSQPKWRPPRARGDGNSPLPARPGPRRRSPIGDVSRDDRKRSISVAAGARRAPTSAGTSLRGHPAFPPRSESAPRVRGTELRAAVDPAQPAADGSCSVMGGFSECRDGWLDALYGRYVYELVHAVDRSTVIPGRVARTSEPTGIAGSRAVDVRPGQPVALVCMTILDSRVAPDRRYFALTASNDRGRTAASRASTCTNRLGVVRAPWFAVGSRSMGVPWAGESATGGGGGGLMSGAAGFGGPFQLIETSRQPGPQGASSRPPPPL